MIALRFQCPHCRRLFVDMLGSHRQHVTCSRCQRDITGADVYWTIRRQQQSFGPYSWAQLTDLADAGQLLATDTAVSQLDQVDPAFVPLSTTAEEAVQETELLASPRACQIPFKRPDLTLRLADFQIVRKLGTGGMGTVFLAYQRDLERTVALKLLSPPLTAVRGFVERFYREASVLSRLQHPNIVACYGVGQERGVPFFSMEFVDGFSTATLLKHLGHPLAVTDALYIVRACLVGLGYAHDQGIVHRDVKPQNILVTLLGRIKVTDLGLAKPVEEDVSLTESGLTMGTPRFMAPEQARNAKHADHRSDIYALGGVLYFFLTGRPPFPGETAAELLLSKEKGHFPSVRHVNPDVPSRLSLILDKMLARDPQHRFRSCGEIMEAIDTLGLPHEHLGFNPLRVVPETARLGESDATCVEILLIHDSPADILLAHQALKEKSIPNTLHSVRDGLEALAFLHKEGRFADALDPELVIVGAAIEAPGILDVLEELTTNPRFSHIPVVVLARSEQTQDILNANNLAVKLLIATPSDLNQFEELLQSVQGICLTVLDRTD